MAAGSKKKKQLKGKREMASVVRRKPVGKLSVMSQEDEAKAKEMMKNESAFLLAWLGIGGIILFQGIALAASGMLVDENWSRCFVDAYIAMLFAFLISNLVI